MKPPIIIIGMHRSGTSMISRFLEEAGLFQGMKKDPNNEAFFFLRVNEWILQQSGGTWDHPQTIERLLDDDELRLVMRRYLTRMLNSPHLIEYLGLRRYFKSPSALRIDFSWGWKDPRSTFTLPLWRDIFPEARVVHIARHGIDVANSLLARRQKGLPRLKAYVEKPKWRFWWNPLRPDFLNVTRTRSIKHGFALWKTYMRKANEMKAELGDKLHEVGYERYLEKPEASLRDLCAFCDIAPEQAVIDKALSKIDASRAYSYRKNSKLMAFEEGVKHDLRRYHY